MLTKKSGVGWSADPENAQALARAGFTILNLSNNHIGDCGDQGIRDTFDALTDANLKYVGVGRGLAEARRPIVVEKNGVKIGFLSYCDSYVSRSKRLGGAPGDSGRILSELSRSGRSGADDLLGCAGE